MKIVAVGPADAREDVLIETGDDVAVEAAANLGEGSGGVRRRRSGRSPSQDQDRALLEGLEASGFDVAANARLTPAEPGRTTRSREGTTTKLRVKVGAGEGAVALIEGEGGVFAWVQPDEAPGSGQRRAAPDVVTFTFDAAGGRSPAGRPVRGFGLGWLVDVLTRPVRVLVLRFAVRLTVDAAVGRIEGGNATGLLAVAGLSPETWKPSRIAFRLPDEDRPLRALLLIHGTFSSTAASFGHLATHADGRAFLEGALATYDAVLGFDHKTLAADVETNAEELADALASLPRDSVVDCVAFSRGGLVYRVLAEEVMPKRRPDVRFEKAVFVGCANGGTHLAHPKNWEALVDLYTNVVMAGARVASVLAGGGALDPFVKLGVKTLGEFVQMLPQVAISERRVPGLASMRPDGPTVTRLHAAQPAVAPDWFVVTSDFEPRADAAMGISQRLREFLLDRVTDDLWQGHGNDLVVDTSSMSSFGPGWTALPTASTHSFGKTGLIYHTVYFASPETCRALSTWLDLPAIHADVPERVGRKPVPSDASDAFESVSGDGERWSGTVDDADGGSGSHPGGLGGLLGGLVGGSVGTGASGGSGPNPGGLGGLLGSILGGSGALGGRRRRGPTTDVDPIRPPSKEPDPAAAEAGAADDGPVEITVSAQAPGSAPAGEVVDLEVTVSREDIDVVVGLAAGKANIVADPRRDLKIQVSAHGNCEIVGSREEVAPLPRPGAPETFVFQLRGLGAGPAEAWVSVLQGARRLARIVLQPTFVTSAVVKATAIVSSADVDPPLVNLRIFEELTGGGHWRLRFVANSEELGIEALYETKEIRVDKTKYIADLYGKLEEAWASTEGDFAPFMTQMQSQGVELFRGLIPAELQEIIWTNRDRIGSVQVFSYEPSIPWEVAFVAQPGKVATADGRFLSEFGLTRWISNVGVAPARLRLRPGKALYCIPEYLDASYHLPSAAREASMLRRKLGATPLDPHLRPVLSALGRKDGSGYDLLHFACHGSGDAESIWNAGLMLAGVERNGRVAREELRPADIRAHADLVHEDRKPIVFLNACQTGVGGETLTGSGGLAQAFVERGAGVFVGTLWSVGDTTASAFCEAFYDALQAGRSLSQAARQARERAKGENETTWLAYTVYGHPYARVQPA